MLELNSSGFVILIALTSLMKIVWSFVWRKFSSVGREEWCNEMKYGQKLKLGNGHVTPKNIQEVQASKLGDAQGIPFFINKVSGHLSICYIFIASYAMCCSWSVFVFVFSFLLFCFSIYFATVLNLKIIQTMPKAPLNIFILLDGLFQKLIKYFRDIWNYILIIWI